MQDAGCRIKDLLLIMYHASCKVARFFDFEYINADLSVFAKHGKSP
jgi:hypothetical protein